MVKQTTNQIKDKKVGGSRLRTLFLIMIPSILIAGDFGGSLFSKIALDLLLLFYQYVVLKSFIDHYYNLVD